MSENLFWTFPNQKPLKTLSHGQGSYVFDTNGDAYLDLTSGFTGHAILGWGDSEIVEAISSQSSRIGHIDYKVFNDTNRETLAELIIKNCEADLTRVFFAGGAGAEACESAVHLSYQSHYECGKGSKSWYISREQSYHGATTESMALGHRPNLEFFSPLFPERRAKIREHNKYRGALEGESETDYEDRCVSELETKILEIGPNNVGGFVAETIMGGLVGDVPPTKYYWQKVRNVCDKYGVHLILDEVWCGGGTSGKFLCCDWDGVTPDILFSGKTLAAGYQPVSVVLTTEMIYKSIANGSGRTENSTTFQGHSVGVAAALVVQQKILRDNLHSKVEHLGKITRDFFYQELKDTRFFSNVRGRGLRNSIEYKCDDQHLFGSFLAERILERHKTFISGKWHRISLSPAMNIERQLLLKSLEGIVKEFRFLAENWSKIDKSKINTRAFF